MSKSVLLYSCFMLFGTFISSISQVFLKKSADTDHKSIIREYFNVKVIMAYVLFFLATVCSIVAYRGIPLSLGPVLESTGYIYVTIFDICLFKQSYSVKKIAALAIIIIGIVVYSTA